MRLICATCGIAPAEPDAAAAPEHPHKQQHDRQIAGSAPTCAKCEAPLQRPTVFDCARHGLLEELKELIEEDAGFDINAVEEASNATLLHHAAINSKMRILEYLFQDPVLKTQIKVDPLGGELQTTPLFWAAYHNHIYAVELLLRQGADASFTDAAGFNPFLLCIQRCFPITAAYLIAKGTDIDVRVKDKIGKTALMLLSNRQRFHLDSYRMVLSLQASIDLQDSEGNTALHHAAANDVGLAVRMLLDCGADPTIVNTSGETPLDCARKHAAPNSTTLHLLEEDRQLQQLAKWTSIPKRTLEGNVYKLSFFVPWLFIPASCAIVVYSHGFFRIMWQQGVLVAITIALLKLLQRGSYGDKKKAAALLFGVNVASIAWLVASFPLFARVTTSFQICTVLSILAMCVCLYKTATLDAGVVTTLYHEKLENIRTLVESKRPSATKLCLTCLHRRPLRAKHCAEMNACIAKFDHYCPFVNNAIGAHNHHYFFGFLLFAVLSICLELVACWQFASHLESLGEWHDGGRGRWFALWWIVHFHPVLFCVVVLDIVQVAWIAYLLFFHAYLVAAALTTNEFVKNENTSRAYSRGSIWRNCLTFFFLEKQTLGVDWRRVFTLEEYHASSSSTGDDDVQLPGKSKSA
uniref:Palmitoyltransferase n=1 Tax=Globisporangium ultimum (strain ATCC 200006 / CBS 805.95 / DAOM BR144) TaxID=431595 RepID=K3WIL0_GLOUD